MFFFFVMIRPPPRSTLFPYTTLFRSDMPGFQETLRSRFASGLLADIQAPDAELRVTLVERKARSRDRKSTRLNSSHLGISYAVFCLKKKKHTKCDAQELDGWTDPRSR